MSHVLGAFLAGIIITFPVFIIELLHQASQEIETIVAAPIIEECAKFGAVLFVVRVTWKPYNRSETVCLAISVAVAFGTIENAVYLLDFFQKAHGAGLLPPLRSLISIPGHALMSCFWGSSLGIPSPAVGLGRGSFIAIGLIVSIAMHGPFNAATMLGVEWLLLAILLAIGGLEFVWLRAPGHPESGGDEKD